MKRIVHCECGLGNQMCFYAQFMAIKKTHPDDEIYLETFLYDVPGIDQYMKMWNGFELDKVFNIKAPRVTQLLRQPYDKVVEFIKNSRFWEEDWSASSKVITSILNSNGIVSEKAIDKRSYSNCWIKDFYIKHRNSLPGYLLRKVAWSINGRAKMDSYGLSQCFDKNDRTEYFSDLFSIISPNSGLDTIKKEVFNSFSFPKLREEKNIEASIKIENTNSVSIHIRKSDCYKYNADCFKFGFFKRSVSYIKSRVYNPVFFVFSDDQSWVINNLDTLGLDETDNIIFITWNSGADSFVDMQLMSLCKHNISTNSTFGFWASYLNKNPDKITCAPVGSFAVTNWF